MRAEEVGTNGRPTGMIRSSALTYRTRSHAARCHVLSNHEDRPKALRRIFTLLASPDGRSAGRAISNLSQEAMARSSDFLAAVEAKSLKLLSDIETKTL